MKSNLFQSLMLLFLIGTGLGVLFRKALGALLSGYGIPLTKAFLSLEFLLLSVLVFWIYNAVDAYRATARARRVPFRGIENKALPALASLLIPGWGQFMNGHPRKEPCFPYSLFSTSLQPPPSPQS